MGKKKIASKTPNKTGKTVAKKATKKRTEVKKSSKGTSKKKKGFTLIELLAVIIILGILMIIAIPSVTKYINDSRKSSYVDTAKEVIGSARNLVNSGELEMYDTDATYYLDVKCIKTENAMKSPYGEFVDNGAYVIVTFDGQGYDYYWTSVDDAGQGIKNIVKYDKLDSDDVLSDLSVNDINTKRTLDGRGKVIKIDKEHDCKKTGFDDQGLINVSSETGEESGGSGGSGGTTPSNIVCRKATTLHQKTCENASDGCGTTIGNGNKITYGTLVSGTRKAGDAYDCDVDNDGTYDSETERFYYVKSEGNNSILIYYTNMNDQTPYAYDSSSENWHGPRTGYQYLPDTSTWNNPGLIAPGTRQIFAENGATSTSGGTLPGADDNHSKFNYTGKAARFLTYQEVQTACGNNVTNQGDLNNCTWLMENLGRYEGTTGANGYWLETPLSFNTSHVWNVVGYNRYVSGLGVILTTSYGVRPVITVLTSNIEN